MTRLSWAVLEHIIEYVFVDDKVQTGLWKSLNLAAEDENVKYLSFSRYFGHQSTLKARLDFSTGYCVISMDAYLQHPCQNCYLQ